MIKNIIFDWAGTLCDDQAYSLYITNILITEMGGLPIDMAMYRREFSIPVIDFYRRILNKPVDEKMNMEAMDERYTHHYIQRLDDAETLDCAQQKVPTPTLFMGITLLIHWLQFRGYRLSILSTLDNELIYRLIKKFELDIPHSSIYGGASDKQPVLTQLMRDLDYQVDETLFMGDSLHDIAVGNSHGLISAAAGYGYTDIAKLKSALPDHTFADVAELIRFFDRDYLINHYPLVLTTVGGLVQATQSKRILFIRTAKWSNKWGTPGGKVDYGESLQQAYFREVYEEVGLTLDNMTEVMVQESIEDEEFVYPQHFILHNYFSTITLEQPIKANYESNTSGWFSIEEALLMDLNRPTRKLLERVIELKLNV